MAKSSKEDFVDTGNGFCIKEPKKSILISEQPSKTKEQIDYSKEVSETYNILERALSKIKEDSDGDEKFSNLTIRDLIIRNTSEYILVLASRLKKKQDKQKQNEAIWKNLMKK
jgi:hypothetical protein